MTDKSVEKEQKKLEFSDAHELQLLQLLARKSIVSRKGGLKEPGQDSADECNHKADSKFLKENGNWQLISKKVKLYDWQQECLPIWLEKNGGRGTVKVATGGGKTLFALAAAQALQNTYVPELKLLIVVPTIPLMFQWHDEFSESNLPPGFIGLMGGGQELSPSPNLRVLICVLASARDRLVPFVKSCGWDSRSVLMVVDECHHANASQASRIFTLGAGYTLGLSATPEKDTESSQLPKDDQYALSPIGQGLGRIIYNFSLQQSLDAGLLTPFEVLHIGLPLSSEEADRYRRFSHEISELRRDLQRRHQSSRSSQSFIAWCQTQAARNGVSKIDAQRFIGLTSQRKRLLYGAAARRTAVLEILGTSADDSQRAIVFHESIEQIEEIFIQTLELGLPAVLEHSNLPSNLRDQNIDAFRRGVAKAIISARSLIEGFNVPSADLGIIAASNTSVRQRIQSLGRMLRKNPGGQRARVFVLYIRDTEDESIYQKADWEDVLGAERNRYFVWDETLGATHWMDGLVEINDPPRAYRPPSWEIEGLEPGDDYPGRTDGLELKLDQNDNLRTVDGALVPASAEIAAQVLETNRSRRAVRTPAGHLIVRCDSPARDRWRFLGMVEEPSPSTNDIIQLKVVQRQGRRVLSKKQGSSEFHARTVQQGASESGDEARRQLIKWIDAVEQARHVSVKNLFWDGAKHYWLELEGQRLDFDGELAPLEFRE